MSDPYQPPVASLEAQITGSEQTRARLIGHEARCLALGWLLVGLGVLVSLALLSDALHGVRAWSWTLLYLALLVPPPLGTGLGLIRLKETARVVAAPVFGLLLFLFPIGTFLGGYALWTLFSQEGGVVYSLGYQGVREQTPELKPSRTPSLGMILALAAIATASLLV